MKWDTKITSLSLKIDILMHLGKHTVVLNTIIKQIRVKYDDAEITEMILCSFFCGEHKNVHSIKW